MDDNGVGSCVCEEKVCTLGRNEVPPLSPFGSGGTGGRNVPDCLLIRRGFPRRPLQLEDVQELTVQVPCQGTKRQQLGPEVQHLVPHPHIQKDGWGMVGTKPPMVHNSRGTDPRAVSKAKSNSLCPLVCPSGSLPCVHGRVINREGGGYSSLWGKSGVRNRAGENEGSGSKEPLDSEDSLVNGGTLVPWCWKGAVAHLPEKRGADRRDDHG